MKINKIDLDVKTAPLGALILALITHGINAKELGSNIALWKAKVKKDQNLKFDIEVHQALQQKEQLLLGIRSDLQEITVEINRRFPANEGD
jgi:hypothetical protein